MPDNDDLPDHRPPRQHPPLMDLSFAALGWINRAAGAAGADRFAESVRRARFYLGQASRHAWTPADRAVITGLAASLEAVILADAEARAVLGESVSGIADACAAEVDQLLETAEEA